jgi:hypothetical protein
VTDRLTRYYEKGGEVMKLFGAIIALGGALLAVEMFYEHQLAVAV